MIDFFFEAYRNTPVWAIVLEAIAFVTGIASVWFAKKENILVYPVGLIGTTITGYLLYRAEYFGDMCINFYYSLMSFYGWYKWARGAAEDHLEISRTSNKEKIAGFGMFILTIVVILVVYRLFGTDIKTENYFDILTSGIFFTAMWFMALKKLESWTLWIIGDIIAIPLYAYRGLGMLSFQYLIFTILAIQAYIAWKKILNRQLPIS